MTDLVKVYNRPASAKAVARKNGIEETAVVVKGGQAAIVEKQKYRAHVIRTPREMTIREFVWQTCNALQATHPEYKLLRRECIEIACKAGYKLSGIQAEISRWRHRFN